MHLALHSSVEARAGALPLLQASLHAASARTSPEPPSLTDSVSDVLFSVHPHDDEHPHFRQAPTASHPVPASASACISRRFSNVINPAFTQPSTELPGMTSDLTNSTAPGFGGLQPSASAVLMESPSLDRALSAGPARIPVEASMDDSSFFDPAATVNMAPPLGVWSLHRATAAASSSNAHGQRAATAVHMAGTHASAGNLSDMGNATGAGVRESVADAQHVLNSSFTRALSREQGRGSIDMLHSFGDLQHLVSSSVDEFAEEGADTARRQ